MPESRITFGKADEISRKMYPILLMRSPDHEWPPFTIDRRVAYESLDQKALNISLSFHLGGGGRNSFEDDVRFNPSWIPGTSLVVFNQFQLFVE